MPPVGDEGEQRGLRPDLLAELELEVDDDAGARSPDLRIGEIERSPIAQRLRISLSIAEIVRTSGANYSRMTEMITPYNTTLAMPGLTGAWTFDTVPGLAKVANEIARQSAMIGYLNAFMMYTVTSALAVGFALMVRRPRAARAA